MREIFVFGSNTEGRHDKGAALEAKEKHGAIYGAAFGLQGDSYAIITKDLTKPKWLQNRSVPLVLIHAQVAALLCLALTSKGLWVFNVCAIGCGLSGYTPEEIAPMFKGAPSNVNLPKEFLEVLNEDPTLGL